MRGRTQSDAGEQLAGGRGGRPLPAASRSIAPAELREQLPGLEGDRRIDDWGRSERLERALDATLYDFLYHHWFRVEAEGLEHVPAGGGALLVANHAGALAAGAAMIAKAIREEHRHPRPLSYLTDAPIQAQPGFAMLATKLGVLPAHPANLQRLLFDERALVLVFPEGRAGARKPLAERYRLAPFDGSAFVAAARRAAVPIVPVAVLGAEEALPTLGSLPWRALLGPLAAIGPLRSPGLPPLRLALPLPAKLRIRFLEPIRVHARAPGGVEGERGAEDEERIGEEIRALIQANLLELVAARRSVWLG